MILKSKEDWQRMREIGLICAETICLMKKHTVPGITTKELDQIGEVYLHQCGAVSAPMEMYNFPGATCISVNSEAAHGIPSNRKLLKGDLVNIDVSAVKNGFYSDCGHSFQIPPHDDSLQKLCRDTYDAMIQIIKAVKPGMRVNDIGRLMQAYCEQKGWNLITNLCSHGIGRSLHEDPRQILPFFDKREKRIIKKGLTLTIEPFFSTGATHANEQADGWTLKTPDGSYVAQHEHTIVVTENGGEILTPWDNDL